MVELNRMLVNHTSIAGTMVVSAVVLKNTLEQSGMKSSPYNFLGKALFAFGWLYTAYILAYGRNIMMWQKFLYFFVPSMAILGSVFMMKSAMMKGLKPHIILPIIFALKWLTLGYFASSHLYGVDRWLGVVAACCVILSMLLVLPWQRKKSVVDGPGMHGYY